MKRPVTFVRFDVQAVQQLLLTAKARKHDSVWLIRSADVRFALPFPDENEHVVAQSVLGDEMMAQDYGQHPRVEVVEAHNFVLKAMRVASVPLQDRYLEVRLTEDDDLCLAIVQDTVEPVRPKIVYRMPRKYSGLFDADSMFGGGW